MMTNERTVCPRCGRPVNSVMAGQAGEAAGIYVFGQTMRRLRQYWFLFACLSVALGVAGLVLAKMGEWHHLGPWEPWPHPPLLEWTIVGGSAWTLLIVRVALAAAASMGLRDRAAWARPVTVIAAAVAMTQFPIGLLLGAYTLVKVVGKQNAALFRKFVVHGS
jgi:hypothetical protein